MKEVVIFILGLLIGGFGVWIFLKNKTQNKIGEFSFEQQQRKEEGKGRILELLQEKEQIKNDDVQELLKVSDATATNYLQQLENEGRIKQVGEKGRFVIYKLNG